MTEQKTHFFLTKSHLYDIGGSLLMALVFFALGYLLGQSRLAPLNFIGPAADTPQEAREAFASFWEVWQLVNTSHLNQPLDQALLAEGAINGMLAALEDPYTSYLPPTVQEAAEMSFEGQIEGIGAEVQSIDGQITIISPFDGSPAAAAGLRPQDIIRQVDGVDVTGLDVGPAAALVRGPAGSEVTLTIERDGTEFVVTVIRAVVEIASVQSQLLEDGFLLIRLSLFGEQTAAELQEALSLLENEREPVSGIILDLRRNPGGSLNTVVDVADQFLTSGTILIEEYSNGRRELSEASERGLATDIPLVVLIDEGSASASEVLAGALQDLERATLVGSRSFGKGTIQSWNTLRNGGGVRITVARWLTPAGRWVHETGLVPDFEVASSDNPAADPFFDPQLAAAITQLRKQIEGIPTAARPITPRQATPNP